LDHQDFDSIHPGDLKTNKVYYPWGGTSRGTLSKSSKKIFSRTSI
jgi:hypothetical protein